MTTKRSTLTVHDMIKPLYYLSRSASLWPYKYEKLNKIRPLTKVDKIRALILATIIAICDVWNLQKSYRNILKQPVASILITTILLSASGLTVFSIFLLNSAFGESNKAFFLQLEYIRKKLVFHTNRRMKDVYKSLLIQLLIICLFGILITIVDIGVHGVVMDMLGLLKNISKYLTRMVLVIIFLNILFKVELLINHFQHLNDTFTTLAQNRNTVWVSLVNNSPVHQKCSPKTIRELSKIHKQLCDLIEIVNNSHGWQIAVIFVVVVVGCLTSLYFGITRGVKGIAGEPDSMSYARIVLACEYVAEMFFNCILLILLSAKCSFATKEALKIGMIAKDILLDMEVENSNKSENIFKEQLQLLLQHISYSNIHFTAAGIFTVDYRMISMLAGTVTTYIIVCLQFPLDQQ